jgi:hypothetical protein
VDAKYRGVEALCWFVLVWDGSYVGRAVQFIEGCCVKITTETRASLRFPAPTMDVIDKLLRSLPT